MLESTEGTIRCKAVKIVQETRKKPPKISRMKVLRGIRKFSIPALNWNPSSWVDIIDWKAVKVYEPSILTKLSSDELILAQNELLPKFPPFTLRVWKDVLS